MVRVESTQPRIQAQEADQITLRQTRIPNALDVELRLDLKTVYPGRLDFNGEGIFRSKGKPDQFHRNSNGRGVSAELFDTYKFMWVSIRCGDKEFLTSKDVIPQFGKLCAPEGYENQWFLAEELWGLDAVEQFERHEVEKPEHAGVFEVTA